MEEDRLSKYDNKMYQEGKLYVRRGLLSKKERLVFDVVEKHLSKDYVVYPQGNLQAFIFTPNNKKCNDELFRNVDFVIYHKDNLSPVIGIEVNDPRHDYDEYVKRRDVSVGKILECINVDFEFIKNSEVDEEYEQQEKHILKLLKSKSDLLNEILK